MTTYLKIIGPDYQSVHGGNFDYTAYLPNGDEPGSWLPEREAVICASGWHWCTPDSLMGRWAYRHMRVYEAEPSDDVTAVDADGKCVSSSGRLLRSYPLPDWWTEAMAYCQDVIPQTPWMHGVTDPDPAWRLYQTRDAAYAAAWAAARSAAQDAAWDAAWGGAQDAAQDAARDAAWAAAGRTARDAAQDAARDAAWRAAWGGAQDGAQDAAWRAAWRAAWGGARDVARDAVRDASLYVVTQYVCRDLPLDPKHREHAAQRWDVWQRGYGLVGEVDGVLYVYERSN
jgi:hypothetical protein